MLKKTITYEDFNGEEVSEDFFFHLSKAELVEIEMSHKGGLSEAIQRIMAAEDNASLIAEFKNLILLSYGKRSEDGKRFVKDQETRDDFVATGAYSALFMEFVTNTEAAIEFINGVIPADLAEEAAELVKKNEEETAKTTEIVTPKQVEEMSAEELQQLGARIQSGEVKLSKGPSQE